VALRRGSVSPYSGGTVPESHRVPFPLAGIGRELIIGRVPRSRAVRVWLPVVAWAAVIFALSSIPSLSTGLGFWDAVLRKCAHAAEYAILGGLLLRAAGRPGPALALGVAYAASDEVHQHFVRGRHASPVDVAIDTVGVLAGLALLERIRTR
jgi:VanZ family protein